MAAQLTARPGRNYGIDLLRMLSMLMIVVLHTLGHGGALGAAAAGSANQAAAWLLEALAFCAVNCYALISGYVGSGTKFRPVSIAMLWLQVTAYNAVITAGEMLLRGAFEPRALLVALFPVTNSAYWYFTAYFGLMLLTPLLSIAIEHASTRRLGGCCLALAFFFTLPQTLSGLDVFRIANGYHVLWLAALFLMGAYINKYGFAPRVRAYVWALIYLGSVLVSWGADMLSLRRGAQPELALIRYTSPTMLTASAALLMLFSRLRPGARLGRVIGALSPLSFGVYLIHDHRLVRTRLIQGEFARLANARSPLHLMGCILLASVCIYLLCSAIEYLRALIFRALRVREGLTALEGILKRRISKNA